MKRAIGLSLIGLLLFFGIQSFRKGGPEHNPATNFLSYPGTIREIREGKQTTIVVQASDEWEDAIAFNLGSGLVILDDASRNTFKGSFEVGQRVTIYYPDNSPMTLSQPPLVQPAVVVTNSTKRVGAISVAYFDDTLTSHDGQLKLNLGTKMTIVDSKGKPVTKIANKTLVVFYTISTRSIPAQTTPEKIIVL